MNKIGVQTGDWYDELFGDENVEKAFAFIKDRGFDEVDYNLNNMLQLPQINARVKVPFYEQTRQEIREYFRPMKAALQKTGLS